ncbi:cupin [Affinirhizobium pseudoryzae]|uniref:cupin n=1 Tax=Allorhizobium pseudoryzae TaxID=379684 RepID=UPI0013EB889B|nr:cupin [Allorhizobium pseudoryzae]
MTEPDAMMFEASDWVPNHSVFPVLLYSAVLPGDDAHRAEAFEERFSQNGWQDIWQNGIFPYQHYHSRAHEVLGIAKGHVRLLIGGSTGKIIEAKAGDCLVLPAGTGHMRLEATADFLVIGAYPPGQEADILTDAPTEAQKSSIATLPPPETDPLFGPDGPLGELWRAG